MSALCSALIDSVAYCTVQNYLKLDVSSWGTWLDLAVLFGLSVYIGVKVVLRLGIIFITFRRQSRIAIIGIWSFTLRGTRAHTVNFLLQEYHFYKSSICEKCVGTTIERVIPYVTFVAKSRLLQKITLDIASFIWSGRRSITSMLNVCRSAGYRPLLCLLILGRICAMSTHILRSNIDSWTSIQPTSSTITAQPLYKDRSTCSDHSHALIDIVYS